MSSHRLLCHLSGIALYDPEREGAGAWIANAVWLRDVMNIRLDFQTMPEVLFYHLDRQPLEQVLPVLLQKSLQRGWRVLVRSGEPERLRALSDAVWRWHEEAFIPHGLPEEGHARHQPVWMTHEGGNPNGAAILFCVAGAEPDDEEISAFARVIVMFSQHEPALLEQARALWRRLGAREDISRTYWRQDARGRWQRQA